MRLRASHARLVQSQDPGELSPKRGSGKRSYGTSRSSAASPAVRLMPASDWRETGLPGRLAVRRGFIAISRRSEIGGSMVAR